MATTKSGPAGDELVSSYPRGIPCLWIEALSLSMDTTLTWCLKTGDRGQSAELGDVSKLMIVLHLVHSRISQSMSNSLLGSVVVGAPNYFQVLTITSCRALSILHFIILRPNSRARVVSHGPIEATNQSRASTLSLKKVMPRTRTTKRIPRQRSKTRRKRKPQSQNCTCQESKNIHVAWD